MGASHDHKIPEKPPQEGEEESEMNRKKIAEFQAEALAHQRLIAAAPEMLEALKLVDYMGRGGMT